MPEGLTPLSPKDLDRALTPLIERYTLQGESVLAHCRGGVGRAGLVAACWALKLGLLGWLETDPAPAPQKGEQQPQQQQAHLRRDTLALVQRAISVLRARRSTKAIETYEQVRFLVEWVEYLRAQGRWRSPASAATDEVDVDVSPPTGCAADVAADADAVIEGLRLKLGDVFIGDHDLNL
jgi:hypothetical protein